jgi:hypothetical protein
MPPWTLETSPQAIAELVQALAQRNVRRLQALAVGDEAVQALSRRLEAALLEERGEDGLWARLRGVRPDAEDLATSWRGGLERVRALEIHLELLHQDASLLEQDLAGLAALRDLASAQAARCSTPELHAAQESYLESAAALQRLHQLHLDVEALVEGLQRRIERLLPAARQALDGLHEHLRWLRERSRERWDRAALSTLRHDLELACSLAAEGSRLVREEAPELELRMRRLDKEWGERRAAAQEVQDALDRG